MSRPLPETHESRLKTVLKLEEHEDLPNDVQALYWQAERCSRKIRNGGVSDEVLIFVAILSGAYSQPEKESFLETARELDRGHSVEVMWRGDWIPAEYTGIKQNRIVIRIANDIEGAREFEPSEVRLAPDAVLSE